VSLEPYDYRVTVTAGTHTWERDATDPTGGYGLTDDLVVIRSVPDSDLWPVQPNPAECRFGVVVENADDLADLDIGTPVVGKVYMPAAAAEPVEQFHGRIADGDSAPHKVGAVWRFVCLDYLADLLEEAAWTSGRQSTFFGPDDLNVFFDGFGIPEPPVTPAIGVEWRLKTPSEGERMAPLDYINRLLISAPQTWAGGLGRYVIAPVITDDLLDEDTPFELLAAYRDLPAGHDSYDDEPDPLDPAVIDAANVERSNTFRLRKYDAVKRVVINYTELVLPAGEWEARTEDAALLGWTSSTVVDTELLFITGDGVVADTLAASLLLPYVPRARYTTDSLRWLLHKETPGRYLAAGLGDYIAVNGVEARWNPLGNTWLVGRLTSYTLTILGTRPVIDITFRDPGT